MSSVLFFFTLVSLFFWWISRSSSVSLLMVLAFSLFGVILSSFTVDLKIPLFMIVLALSGGLFVLISFVIMFFPGDFKSVVFSGMSFWSLFMMLLVYVSFVFFLGGELFEDVKGLGGESVKVWGNFFFVYVCLIVLLFLFLFLINSILNQSTGGMFSGKKLKGKMMG